MENAVDDSTYTDAFNKMIFLNGAFPLKKYFKIKTKIIKANKKLKEETKYQRIEQFFVSEHSFVMKHLIRKLEHTLDD